MSLNRVFGFATERVAVSQKGMTVRELYTAIVTHDLLQNEKDVPPDDQWKYIMKKVEGIVNRMMEIAKANDE